jgi:hypothetical protein
MHKNNYESNIEKLASFEYKKTIYIFSPFNKVWSVKAVTGIQVVPVYISFICTLTL